ncbi:hypothetical protein [Yersinia hibernica]|uniref:hypothetical protein n=1 Tax=Yersinia hibernica TaxID=2339259 RepID=UPI001643D2BB|nr:hypothetical protein [Yersinia hibernica]
MFAKAAGEAGIAALVQRIISMTINSSFDNQMAAFWAIKHKQALQAAELCL